MPYSTFHGPRKRTLKTSHEARGHDHNDPTTSRDPQPRTDHDPELERRCKESIMSLQLSPEEDLAEVESFKGVDWLREETPWPSEAQRRVHRYMHYHNLYQVTSLDDPLFVDLVNLVKSEAGVPNTRNWEQKVPGKCRVLIDTSTRAWKKDRLLVVRNNVTTKCDTFRYLWDCAIQAAQMQMSCVALRSMEQAVPRAGLGNRTSSVDVGLVTVSAGTSEDCYSRKRAAESMHESPSLGSVKRVCRDQPRKLVPEAFADVDIEDLKKIGPASNLSNSISRSPTTVSTAAISIGICHGGDSIPKTPVKGSESAVLAARKAVSALHSTEKGKTPNQEDGEFAQEKEHPHLLAEARGCKESVDSTDQDVGGIKFVGRSPITSNRISSGALYTASASENPTGTALPPPTETPNMHCSDRSIKASLSTFEQSSDTGINNEHLPKKRNERHAESSSGGLRIDSPKNSMSTSRTGHFWVQNTLQVCQAEGEYSSIYETTSGLSRGPNLPKSQPESANWVQYNNTIYLEEEISSSEDSDVAPEQQYSSTSSEAADEIEYLPPMSYQLSHHDLSQSRDNDTRSPKSFNGSIPMVQQTLSYGGVNQSPRLHIESTGPRPSGPSPIATPVQAIPQTASSPRPHDRGIFSEDNPSRDVAGFPNNHGLPSQFSHQTPVNQHLTQQSSSSQAAYVIYEQPILGYQQSKHQPPNSYLNQGPRPPPSSSSQNQCTLCPPPPPGAPPFSTNQNRPSPPPLPPHSSNQKQCTPGPPPPPPLGAPPFSLNQNQQGPPNRSGPPPPFPSSNQNRPHPQPLPTPGPPTPSSNQIQGPSGPPPPLQNQLRSSGPLAGPPPSSNRNQVPPGPPLPPHFSPRYQPRFSPPPPHPVTQRQDPPPPVSNQDPGSSPVHSAPTQLQGTRPVTHPHPPTQDQSAPLSLFSSTQDQGPPLPPIQDQYLLPPPPPPSSTQWQCPPGPANGPSQALPPGPPPPPSSHFQSSSGLPSPGQHYLHLDPSTQRQRSQLSPQYQQQFPNTYMQPHPQFFSSSSPYGGQPPPLPPAPKNQPLCEPPDQSRSPLETNFSTSNTVAGGQLSFEAGSQAWQKFNQIAMVIIPLNMQISTSSISGIPEQYMSFPMAALIAQTVTEFFQWFSGITKTGRHAMLRFELMDFYQGLRATRIVSGDDSNKFEIMKSTAWNSFLRRPSGDAEEAAALRIIITPCSTQPPHSTPFDPVLNSVNTNTANTTIPISGNQSAPASAQTNGELGHASLFHDSSSHQPQPPSSKTPSAKIVIRIQVDGLGRLSRSYDKSVLNSKVNNAKFFEWFAQETGHTGSQKLKFDFKDALPSKSSIVERDNEDHFDLMIHDIKRKFNHAQAYTPDMNEFGILVTDPMWDSGDEDEDEME